MKVLYPGSFDPITKGHMNIIKQATNIFDEVVVGVLPNPIKKNSYFTLEERTEMIKELYHNNYKVKVISSDKLAVDLAILYECKAMIRGLRSIKDFEYEKELSQINKDISDNKVNTICLFADSNLQSISSSSVKEIFNLDKDISKYVDINILKRMVKKRRSQMKLKILGSVSPYPTLDCNCIGYLIHNSDSKILLDCGSGIARLLKFPDDLENLTIIISHLHKDHYSDLSSIAYASFVYHNIGLLKNKVKVYIPDDRKLEDYNYLMNYGNENYMDFYVYSDNDIINIKDINISFFKTTHQIKTYAINITKENYKISYSADTGYNEKIIEFFKDSDLLICESSFLKYQKSGNNHLSASEAGLLAKKSNVHKLILSHLWPEIDKIDYLKEAKEVFSNVDVAMENKVYILKK